jgi:hypothetical protein
MESTMKMLFGLVILTVTSSVFALQPGELADLSVGPAHCVTTKQLMVNNKAHGIPHVTKYDGQINLYIGHDSAQFDSGAGGPNGLVGPLKLQGSGQDQKIMGSSSSHRDESKLPVYGWLAKMVNLDKDKEARARHLIISKTSLDYKIKVNEWNSVYKSSEGYELHSHCSFKSPQPLSEVYGTVSSIASENRGEFNGERNVVEKSSANGKSKNQQSSAKKK